MPQLLNIMLAQQNSYIKTKVGLQKASIYW